MTQQSGNEGQGAGGGGSGGEGGGQPWYAGFQDPQVKEWVGSVNGASPESIAQKAWHLEKVLGADKAGRAVIWPKDDADTEGWSQIHAKLGRPAKPEEYELVVPEGDNGDFAKTVAPVLHKLGITKAQAKGLSEFLNEHGSAQQRAQAEKAASEGKAADLELRGAWGAAYEKNAEMVERAAAKFGMTSEQLLALRQAMGPKNAMEFMHKIGATLVEDSFVGGDGVRSNGAMTPAAAKQRLEELKGDTAWLDKLLAGDTKVRAEKDALDAAVMGITIEELRALQTGRAA